MGRDVPRIVDREILDRPRTRGAFVIESAKANGKTATESSHAARVVLFDVDDAARNAAAVDSSLLLAGDTPRFIDEWHIAPALRNHVHKAADEPSSGRLHGGSVGLTFRPSTADAETRLESVVP